jgi:hypothetical protein
MIEKFLIRFCASEVRIMIARLHERPDDFTYGSRWRDLAEMRQGFTWAERKVLDKEWVKFKKNQKRRELLNLITSEVLNPTPSHDKWGFAAQTTPSSTAQDYQNAVLRAQMNAAQNSAQQMRGYQDPRSLYQGNRNV